MTIIENYYERLLDSKQPKMIRKQIIEFYNTCTNISLAARTFKTTRKTVRKLVRRYSSEGEGGLEDRSRRPHRMPRAISPEVEAKIVALRKHRRSRAGESEIKLKLGQDRIQWFLAKEELSVSTATINRVLHKHDLIKPRKKKWQKRRAITEYRKSLKPLTLWQVDVKYLRDVPNLYSLILDKQIPAYEYTARDVGSGTTFFAYAEEFSMINSMRFIWLLLCHLEFFGVDVKEVVIQTDNGGEFIGSVYAKHDSGFSQLVERVFKGVHRTIPVATPRFNGAVENFHDRVEDEFYDIEEFRNEKSFLGKAYTFSLWFNLERPNMTFKKTPWEMIQMRSIKNPNFMNFPPIILDDLDIYASNVLSSKNTFFSKFINLVPFACQRQAKGKGGYHVSDELILLQGGRGLTS